jgi:hypothetical protein
MKELKQIVESQAEEMEPAPESGERVVDLESFQRRVQEGRKNAARLFTVQPRDSQTSLKAHMDPFDRAMDFEDEVA